MGVFGGSQKEGGVKGGLKKIFWRRYYSPVKMCLQIAGMFLPVRAGSFEGRADQKILHSQALCQMMYALTGDSRFTDLVGELLNRQSKEEETVICEYIDMLEAKGIEKGEKRLAALIQVLLKEKKSDIIALVAGDSDKRQELYKTYGI